MSVINSEKFNKGRLQSTDMFLEEVVRRHDGALSSIKMALAWIVLVVCGVYAFIQLQTVMMLFTALMNGAAQEEGFVVTLIINVVLFILSGGVAVLLFLFKDRLRTEYEYTFTNGTMDFAQVYNNKKRKALGTMNIRNVEAAGMVSSGSFQRYINQQGIKRTNWFLNRDAELFYFYFQKEQQKRIIIIEPSEEMVGLIRKILPQGVWQVN